MIGQAISHYRILEKLGEGGMGEVYKAEDTKLKRQVALKFLPRQMTADPEARERFAREAQAAAALNHPNIVTVHEIGKHEGQVFIAMEYVEGQTLKELISGSVGAIHESPLPITPHPLPITQVIEIATQIASGLAAAHEKGIVHRDIKPQNILVDKDNHVKILDFGLAKLKGVSSLTKESSTLGTVHYMSPEQTTGKEVDHRTDIWSLGVVLYEMLTGAPPFKGDYEQAVIYSILNEEPARVTAIQKNIPPEFDRILDKALAKEPEERYQHVDDLRVDLRHLKRDSRPERRTATTAPLRKIRRRRIWWILTPVVLLAALAAFLFLVPKHKPIAPPAEKSPETARSEWVNSIAVLPFKNLSDSKEDEYFSDGVTEDIIAQLSKISSLKVISRTSIMRFKETSKSVPEIGRELNVGTVLEGSVRRAGDQVRIVAQLIDARDEGHLWAETYDHEMKQIFAVQSDVAQKIASALRARLSPVEKERIEKKQTENMEAYQLYLKGRFFMSKRTIADLRKAADCFNQAVEKDPRYTLAYAGLASAHALLPYYGASQQENHPRALAAGLKAQELDPDLAEVHSVLGYIREIRFEFTLAETEYLRAIELDPNYPTARHWYSTFLRRNGRLDEALAEARRALELDPLSLIIMTNLAQTLLTMRKYEQTVEQCRRIIDLDSDFPWSYLFLGMTAEMRGEYDAAIAEYEKAARLSGYALWGEIGRCHARAGRRAAAMNQLEQLLAYARQGNAVSVQTATLYYTLGQKEEAYRWLEKAVREKEQILSEIHRPVYDDIRSDPRFHGLLRKAGAIK